MPPPSGGRLVDETVRAVSGYYRCMGGIGLDLARVLVPVDRLRDAVGRRALVVRSREVGPHATGSPVPSPAGATVQAADGGPPPTLLVEARGDRPGFGVFLVENLTAEPVTAPISVSTFTDEHGNEVRPRVLLRPTAVTLAPGEQTMVRLAAELDEALEPGVRYHGEIAIPALSERRISVVLRRLAAEPISGEAMAASPAVAGPEASAGSPPPDPATRPGDARSDTPGHAARRRGTVRLPADQPGREIPSRPRRRPTMGRDATGHDAAT